jgi:hypothetical protein
LLRGEILDEPSKPHEYKLALQFGVDDGINRLEARNDLAAHNQLRWNQRDHPTDHAVLPGDREPAVAVGIVAKAPSQRELRLVRVI